MRDTLEALRGEWSTVARLWFWAVVVALTTAAYGLLVGPVLRALFGGEALAWPALLEGVLPSPPSVASLRQGLPVVVVVVAALKGLAHQRQVVGTAALGARITRRLRARAHQRVLALPPDVAKTLGLGPLTSRVVRDPEVVARGLTDGHLRRGRDGLQLVALLGVCLVMQPKLAAVAFGIYPLVFIPIARVGRGLRRAARRALTEHDRLSEVVGDDLAVLPALQLGGRERSAQARFDTAARTLAAQDVRAAGLAAAASPLTEVAGAVALGVTLWLATGWIAAGEAAPEQVLGFFVTLLLFYEPAKGIARAQEAIAPARIAAQRLDALQALPARLRAGDAGAAPPQRAPRVEARGLTVRRGGRTVFADLSITLEPQRLTALTGPNGVGKTTFAWTLAGLVTPTSGAICVDGRALDSLAPTPWRRSVGWVTADAGLGRGRLREAVLDGRRGTLAELDAVAAEAGLSAVVARVGWDATLGDQGAGLSSGERQRVALARALFGGPKLLVLDEPAAHLDADGRASLAALLPSLAEGRTVLLITHDDTLAAVADTVVQLGA